MDKRGTRAVAYTGIAAAGALALLFFSRILPSGQIGIVAAASLFICAVATEFGYGYALGAFAVSGFLGFVIAPGLRSWLYAVFFGYYPIVKLAAEKYLPVAFAWVVKCAAFFAAYLLLTAMKLMPEFAGLHNLGSGRDFVLPVLSGIVFVIFDIGYGKLIIVYKRRIGGRR